MVLAGGLRADSEAARHMRATLKGSATRGALGAVCCQHDGQQPASECTVMRLHLIPDILVGSCAGARPAPGPPGGNAAGERTASHTVAEQLEDRQCHSDSVGLTVRLGVAGGLWL